MVAPSLACQAPTPLALDGAVASVARPARLPAHVRSVTVPDCGHNPTWDAPDAVATVLLEGSAVQLGAR